MKLHKRKSSTFSTAFLIVLLAVAWVSFAPAQLGGRASYVIVNGNSMEPGFHKGDLVVTYTADGYHTGDVVAYRHPDIGPVIHRIVQERGDRFVLKGDNNSWLDSHLPVPSEVIGKSWIHVPSAGKWIGLLRSPLGLAVLVATMGGIVMMTFDTGKNERKRSRPHRPPAPKGGGGLVGPLAQGEQGPIPLLAVVLAVSLLLGVFAFTRPASRTVSEDVGYQHKGEFAYSANVPAGVYDTTEARTGEPVFRRLTEDVDVRFEYQLASETPTDRVEGTHRLVAQISDVNGWKRTIPIQPATKFTGSKLTASGTLDLANVQRVIDELEKRTGFHAERYAVSVVPEVYTRGTLAGEELDDKFSPRLDFWLDPLALQLQTPAATASSDPMQTTEEVADPLKPSQEGLFNSPKTEANSISILGFGLGVSVARLLSLLGLALSLGGLLWLGIPMLRAPNDNEPARIRSRYGQLLVSMSGGDLESEGRVVEIVAFEDLAKIAERSGQSILHRTNGGVHDYYVQEAGMTYHCRAVGQEPEETVTLTTGVPG